MLTTSSVRSVRTAVSASSPAFSFPSAHHVSRSTTSSCVPGTEVLPASVVAHAGPAAAAPIAPVVTGPLGP